MKIIYRISDNSYQKIKLPGATKEFCLQNFVSIFPVENMVVICDNCNFSTIEMVKKQTCGKAELLFTNLSNAGSLRKALDIAMSYANDDLVYITEDDYIHHPQINITDMEQALEYVDYITLYDHPDKYEAEYNFGEKCFVFKTKTKHWRTTLATCMTFATNVKQIKEDLDVWLKHTDSTHPHDFSIFCDLHNKNKELAVCIPGLACHADLTYPMQTDAIERMIEPWAVDLLIENFNSAEADQFGLSGYRKLMMLDALAKIKKPA